MKPTLEELKEQLNSLTEQIKKYESGDRFEVGWYRSIKESDYFIYRTTKEHYMDTHGIVYGVFRTDVSFESYHEGSFLPATPSEVEAALIAEAKKRGFKEGVWFNSIYSGSECYILNCKFEYKRDEPLLKNDALWIDGNTVYMAGQWATIIPQEEKIEIGGYEVKITQTQDPYYNGSGKCMNIPMVKCTSIDGNIFYKDFWLAMKNISEHPKAKGMIGCSKQFDVSLETINKILSKL